jgi:hypothetical protein
MMDNVQKSKNTKHLYNIRETEREHTYDMLYQSMKFSTQD